MMHDKYFKGRLYNGECKSEDFVHDEVAKVEIDNKEFLGSFSNFFDTGVKFKP